VALSSSLKSSLVIAGDLLDGGGLGRGKPCAQERDKVVQHLVLANSIGSGFRQIADPAKVVQHEQHLGKAAI